MSAGPSSRGTGLTGQGAEVHTVVSRDGTPISMITAGCGPDLLLVHGGMCSSSRWAPLWPLLTPHFRVTAVDRRGRGISGDGQRYAVQAEYDDVITVVDFLADRAQTPVDVFGHSYGAVCALGAAAGGAAVRRLVLYEPPGPAAVPAGWLERMRPLIAGGHAGRAMFAFLVEVVGLSPAQVEALRTGPQPSDPLPIVTRTLVREAEALTHLDLPALAATIRQPTLLLLGEVSPPWAGHATTALAASLPIAATAILKSQGHEGVDEAPDQVTDQLLRFLAP